MKKRGFGVKNHFLGSFWAIVTTQTIFMPIRLHGRPSHLTSHHIQVKSCFLVSSSNRFWPFLPFFGSFWHRLGPRLDPNPDHLLFPSFHIIPQVFPNKRSNPRHFIFFGTPRHSSLPMNAIFLLTSLALSRFFLTSSTR